MTRCTWSSARPEARGRPCQRAGRPRPSGPGGQPQAGRGRARGRGAVGRRRRRPGPDPHGLPGRHGRLPLRAAALPALGGGVPHADPKHRRRGRRRRGQARLRRQPLHLRAGAGAHHRGPARAGDHQEGPGRVRTLMAERLLAAHRSGTLQVAIGRSSDYYGPGGANSFVGDILFGAAAKGNRARWLGRLDVPHSLNYLPDVARALATLGARPEAPGEVWHLPAAEPLTGRAFVELIAAALGRPVKVTATSRLALRIAGVFDPGARETTEMLYQWQRPFVLDASKFQRAFGPLEPTPHHRAVATTVAWFRERAGRTRR